MAFLIAYFLVFNAILLMPLRHRDRPAETIGRHATARWVNGSLLFGLPTITFVLQAGLVRDTAFGVALSALALAAFYVVLAWRLRGRAELAVLFEGALAVGTIFLTLVIPFALDARQTGGAWALEGAGLVWIGWRQQRRLARGFGYALLVLAGGVIVLGTLFRPAPTALVNGFVLNAAMLVAGALLAALSVFRARPATRERAAEPLLIGWALLWTLLAIGHQVEHFVPEPLAPAVGRERHRRPADDAAHRIPVRSYVAQGARGAGRRRPGQEHARRAAGLDRADAAHHPAVRDARHRRRGDQLPARTRDRGAGRDALLVSRRRCAQPGREHQPHAAQRLPAARIAGA